MTETPDAAPPPRPTTGNGSIDAALSSLVLGDDVHAHPERFAGALEVLQRALNPPTPPAGTPGPRP